MVGLALLESAGPTTEYGRYCFLSASPTRVVHDVPPRPDFDAFFPAWIGGLKYEAASAFGLPCHASEGEAQTWAFYPSGLVWDREAGTLEVVGQPHVDWNAALSANAATPELTVGEWSADDLDFEAGVAAVQELVRAGEVYQVNLSRGVSASASGDPLAAYLRLANLNPSPFMAYVELGEDTIVSCSPERLVRLWNGEVSARPIAGTRRRGEDDREDEALEAELRASEKERAEHTMLVDLVRHDLGRVSAAGSVRVPDFMLVERYSHVMHLVSEVTGDARPDASLRDVLEATFPGGTITGAPKRRVMEAIRDLEPSPRGWYTGGVGLVSGPLVDVNILIRTASFRRAGGQWRVDVRAGAGVVIDSHAPHEARETRHKAAALLAALTPAATARAARPPAPPRPGAPWSPPAAERRFSGRVLLLDNFDSFTFNLAHDLMALGVEVIVRENTEDVDDLLAPRPTHVLIGPGPGTPSTSGVTLRLARTCLKRRLPLLGICLGHQAIGEVLGGRVERAVTPTHGKPDRVRHDERALFSGIANPATFTRYHSLVVRDVPRARVTARSEDGEVMALEALEGPAWGVQFHPESVLSRDGRTLLGNWLELGSSGEAVERDTTRA